MATLYKKVGRRYIPVSDTEAYQGLPNGCWLIKVDHGSVQTRKCIEPANAALEFAALLKTQKIVDYLYQVSQARPTSTPLTKKQQQMFKEIQKLPPKDQLLHWQYDSLQGMAEKILEKILEK
jgi:hypothetical protein